MAEIQFDAISWTRDENNDIMPLLPPKPFNYPVVDDVKRDVVYGYDDQYTGILDSGGYPPDAPVISAVENEEGTGAIFSLDGESPGTVNELFIAPMGGTFVSKGSDWSGGFKTVLLDAGSYICYVYSVFEDTGASSISNLIHLQIIGTSEGADDNIKLAFKVQKHRAVYWQRSGTDAQGQPTWRTPVEVPCRWTHSIKEIINPQGDKVTSQIYAIVDRDMDVGGVLMRGRLADVVDMAHPKENQDAWEILNFKKTANFKGKRYLREVYL